MFIDTHCHLTERYNKQSELETVLANAKSAGVGAMICACAQFSDFSEAIAVTEKYDNIFCTIGMHPDSANSFTDDEVANIKQYVENPKAVGIGEIGLDYHFGNENKSKQIELFEKQLEVAKQTKMPVAIHTRDAESDTMAILNESVRGVMHCFTGSWEFAKTMLNRGFYFSASGILTFKNSDALRETFAKIPTDKIVIETDSPWCAPVPYRGKPCEPAFVVETAKVLARIKNLQIDELETILKQNTKTLYPKITIK